MTELVVGKRYTFTTKYPGILGGKFKNMQLEALNISSNLAINYGDIHVLHQTIKANADEYDSIKTLNVNNLNWLVFLNLDTKEYKILAKEYIDLTTLDVSGDSYKFMVSNISSTDISVIKKALSELGYFVDEIE
jgi:hypothetical protein